MRAEEELTFKPGVERLAVTFTIQADRKCLVVVGWDVGSTAALNMTPGASARSLRGA